VSSFLDKRHEKKDGTYPVKIVIYSGRSSKLFSLKEKISLTEEDWKKLKGKKVKNDRLIEIRSIINKEISDAEKIIKQLGNDLKTDIFELFRIMYYDVKVEENNPETTFYTLFEENIKNLRGENRIGNAECFECAYKSFYQFNSKLNFSIICPEFLKKYEKWMLDQRRSYTTISIYLKCFRRIINIAIKKGFFPKDKYPFGDEMEGLYAIPKGDNIKKAISIDYLKEVKSFKCPSETSEFYRDLWLLSFYLSGINMCDVYSLKYEQIQDNFIHFIRSKTKRTQKKKAIIQLAISESAKEIILKWGNKDKSPSNYVFDVYRHNMTKEEMFLTKKNKNKAIRQVMNRIGKKLGIDSKMGLYVARHSWATISKNNGISIEEIAENLGHTNIKTTMDYLDSFPKEHKIKNAAPINDLL